MKITINTEDGSGLGTVSVNFEGAFTTDDGGELMIFLKRLMDMEDLCNEDRIKGNAAELLLVKGKKEKAVMPKAEKKVKEIKQEPEPKKKGKVGRPRKNDEFSPYRETEKPTPEVVGDEDVAEGDDE